MTAPVAHLQVQHLAGRALGRLSAENSQLRWRALLLLLLLSAVAAA
jgi:hypothetical protein